MRRNKKKKKTKTVPIALKSNEQLPNPPQRKILSQSDLPKVKKGNELLVFKESVNTKDNGNVSRLAADFYESVI